MLSEVKAFGARFVSRFRARLASPAPCRSLPHAGRALQGRTLGESLPVHTFRVALLVKIKGLPYKNKHMYTNNTVRAHYEKLRENL